MNYQLHHLSKSYGDKVIFQDREITIVGGVVNWVSGPSGIGKTTLLRMLLGLEQPDSGDIGAITKLRHSAVFQEYRLCENLTAIANVSLVTTKERAEALLSAFSLKESMNLPVREFSGGMKQRVSLARALAAPYDILTLDEPFTGLDDAMKQQVIAVMLRETQGKTVLLVTHDEAEAKAMHAQNIITI